MNQQKPLPDLERILVEQQACADYILGDGPDKAAAWWGLSDWYAEECLRFDATD